ncbi:MAG TPA: hypothetical protein VIE44_18785 [Methylomirabilota bacterium]
MEARKAVETGDDGTVDEVPVTLAVFGASPAAAVATVRRRSLASRAGRAGRALGIAWLLAFPAIFFPVAHFVLVPGLVVGGVVLAAILLREDRTLVRIRATCPRCGAALDLTPGGRFRIPRAVQCVHCKNELTLGAADSPPGRRPAD